VLNTSVCNQIFFFFRLCIFFFIFFLIPFVFFGNVTHFNIMTVISVVFDLKNKHTCNVSIGVIQIMHVFLQPTPTPSHHSTPLYTFGRLVGMIYDFDIGCRLPIVRCRLPIDGSCDLSGVHLVQSTGYDVAPSIRLAHLIQK